MHPTVRASSAMLEGFRAWLREGREEGVTRRRRSVATDIVFVALVVWLVLTDRSDQGARLVEILLIFIAADRGIYMTGRVVSASRAANSNPGA